MANNPTRFPKMVNERSTAIYRGIMRDLVSQIPIEPGQIDSLTLDYFDVATEATINGRTAQDAFNANGVTVAAGGVVTFKLSPNDTIMVDPTKPCEPHRAEFDCVFNNGTDRATIDMEVIIRNLKKIV